MLHPVCADVAHVSAFAREISTRYARDLEPKWWYVVVLALKEKVGTLLYVGDRPPRPLLSHASMYIHVYIIYISIYHAYPSMSILFFYFSYRQRRSKGQCYGQRPMVSSMNQNLAQYNPKAFRRRLAAASALTLWYFRRSSNTLFASFSRSLSFASLQNSYMTLSR